MAPNLVLGPEPSRRVEGSLFRDFAIDIIFHPVFFVIWDEGHSCHSLRIIKDNIKRNYLTSICQSFINILPIEIFSWCRFLRKE